MNTRLKRIRQLLFLNSLSSFGAICTFVFLLLAFLEFVTGSRLTPYNPGAPNLANANSIPSLSHPFGTDFQGRDILSRVLSALPVDIGLPLLIVSASAVIGIIVGTVAGYFGGLLEELIMRLTDMFLAFPAFILALAVAATLGPSLVNAVLSLTFVWWPPYVRLVRGNVLSITTQDYFAASKAMNSSFGYILAKGIVPNVLPAVLVYATMDVGTSLLSLSTLGYLGIGVPPSSPELGSMVSSISYNLYTYPWEALFPALIVLLIVAGFSFLGEGIRESLDIKVRPHILIRNKVFSENS